MTTDRLVVSNSPRSGAAEAFRSLRTNIRFMNPDNDLKSIVVTSSCPGEGKTVLSANLSISLSQLGKRVVCVDADLHKPAIHKLFNLRNHKGLTSALIGTNTLEEVINATDLKDLRVILSGPIPPNPSELLISKKMQGFMEKLRAENDFVIYDSPPVISKSDALVLSSLADGVIMVIDSKISARQTMLHTKQSLELAKAKILGVVLSKVERQDRGYYYSYYYNYSDE